MITLEKLHKVYKQAKREVVALDGVDLHVPAGEIHGVVGPSGSGKSTLLRCVNLLERPTSGRVYVDRTDVTAASGARLRAERRRIGMVFQQFNLLDSRTAADNVGHPLEIAGMGRRERATRAAELLDLVGLGDRATAYPAQLSGGQKQRVGIARALASGPSVLLSDEATSALDPETTASVLRLLRQLAGDLGLTVLLITHEMSVVKQLCDSASLLREGRIVDSGRLADLVSDPDSELARGLLPDLPQALAVPGLTSVDITVTGSNADRPLVAELSRAVELDATILGAAIETVAGRRVGRMHLGLPTDHPRYAEAIRYLDTQGLRPEVAS